MGLWQRWQDRRRNVGPVALVDAAVDRGIPLVRIGGEQQGIDFAHKLTERRARELADEGRLQQAIEVYLEMADGDRRLLAGGEAVGVGASGRPRLAAYLAYALNRISELHHALGRLEPAIAFATEAVEVSRELVVSTPGEYEDDYAGLLMDLAVLLAKAHRGQEAADATAEAVRLRRPLAARGVRNAQANLAGGLSNLGVLLGADRHDEALAALNEAVHLRHRLAEADPAGHEPALAEACMNLGARLAGAGRTEEALAATERAVALYRQLAVTDSAPVKDNLGRAVENLVHLLEELGRPEEAAAERRRSPAPPL